VSDDIGSKTIAQLGEAVRVHALNEFMSRSTSMEVFIKQWLGENGLRPDVPRTEIEQAVRAYLGDTFWEPHHRRASSRPAARSLEFRGGLK
jgi:hypothetical protein